jgi:hypothetical protein
MTPVQTIHHRAILVGIRIKSWSAKKYDREVSDKTAAAHGADASAGRYSKNLLPSTHKTTKTVEKKVGKKGKTKIESVVIETNAHKELIAHIAATYQWVYDQTLAWDDKGWQMLPMANWQPFTTGLRERKHKFDDLLVIFLRDYPKQVADARRLLGDMFKDADYPADIASRFSFDISDIYKPVPESDFRVSLPADEISALTAAAEARVLASVQAAQDDAVKRLYTCLERIHGRLTATRASNRKAEKGEQITARFRDSLVENAREVCDILTRLNVADDARLEQFRRQTELLAAVEPETLRDNPDVAKETATRAQSILDAMTATYGKSLFGGK